MDTKLSLTVDEREEFKNIKMLKEIYNSLTKHMKSLTSEIENYNNTLVDKLNKKYSITMQSDYVYDEIEGDLKHCLSNQQHIESNILIDKNKPDYLDQATGGYFQEMLIGLSKEYKLIEKARGK